MLPKDYKQLCISPENDFLDHQNDQNACINLAERVDFWVKFRSTGNIFGFLELKIIEIFPPIAKCIGKKRFFPFEIFRGKFAPHHITTAQ